MASPRSETGDTFQAYHGRRWFGLILWILAFACFVVAIGMFVVDWTAGLLVGLPCLYGAYACLTIGWGEFIARIELKSHGFSIRLPTYRGYFPFWPARRLSGKWADVTCIRRYLVRAAIMGIRFDYVAHWIETRNGRIMLFEPRQNDYFQNTRGTGLNLPIHDIVDKFVWAGAPCVQGGEVQGGGLLRNVFIGGPWADASGPPIR